MSQLGEEEGNKRKGDGEFLKVNCGTVKRETGGGGKAQKEKETYHYIRMCCIQSFVTVHKLKQSHSVK
jgi:hypothetical protein